MWIVGWITFVVVLRICAPPPEELIHSEPDSLLPPKAPNNQAFEFLVKTFPLSAARSQIIVVCYRPTGLTSADRSYMARLAKAIVQENERNVAEIGEKYAWRVRSPDLQPFLARKLLSADNQVGLIIVNLPVNFITMKAKQAVDAVERLARSDRPEGLAVEFSGSAGVGRDYSSGAKKALDRTMWVTVVAVMVILAVVYRAPLGALVPLVSIGLSVFGAFQVLSLLAQAGWPVSSIEKMFTVVLLFGAGTDYALFWIARYREERLSRIDAVTAASRTMKAVGPAIVASAGTIIFGLAMMMAADFVLSRNAGKVLGLVLALALAASLTLVPAMVVLIGNRLFWPGHFKSRGVIGQRQIWTRLAAIVVARPGRVLLIGFAAMAVPIWTAVRMEFRYDTIAELPPGASSSRGAEMAEDHFPPGEAFATTIVVRHPALADAKLATKLAEQLTADLCAVEDITDVRSLTEPLGLDRRVREQGRMLRLVAATRIAGEYLGDNPPAMRIEFVTKHQPFVEEAFRTITHARQIADQVSDRVLGGKAEILACGLTPYMIDIRDYSTADHKRVTVLVISVILLIVVVLIRDIPLSIFMLAATLMTYLATLGITEWVFVGLLGQDGVDWKAKLFLFVIIVAVGQDYNIFLASRLFQEREHFDEKEATERAIVRTGSIISSCGVIMAATLGSLMASGLKLMEQLGFAMSAGILIDTFLVRPLLIPAFHLLLRRVWKRRSTTRFLARLSSDM
ncbi:MAG: MMPL family transporter [Phycisphaerae bacterium]|nr:MMPL family transporter [Phycisphaerae bacterium]